MDTSVAEALAIGPATPSMNRTVDITTVGARTGQPRRMEIYFWRVEGHWYLASDPGPRSWFINLRADPHFTFHLKHGVHADLPATAVVITDEAARRHVLGAITAEAQGRGQFGAVRLEDWVARSPLVEVLFGTRS
jgi:deazaflavin-dependent oxidoreductase (nitroreductase family)